MTVEYWVKQFNNRGLISLLGRPRTGRPSRISDEIMEKIDQDLRQNPHDFGYKQNMWDGTILRQHLRDRYGIDMGVRQCQNIFHILGFRIRRPRPMIAKSDMEKKGNFKKLLDLISSGSRIMHLDECHFYQHGTRYRMWIPPKDHDPMVPQEPARKGISVFGAVDPCSGVFRASITKKYNAVTFLGFLMGISPVSVGNTHGTGQHKASPCKSAEGISGKQFSHYTGISSYSPELNPDELVWNALKYQELPNFCPEIMDDLKNAVTSTMNKLKSNPERLRNIIRGSSLPLPPLTGKN